MQKSYKNAIEIFGIMMLILLLSHNAIAVPLEQCPDNHISVGIGPQNAHLFRNDINIGIYDALSSEFMAGTNTNITFSINARGEITSLQSFAIGRVGLSSSINGSTARITMRIPQDAHGSHMIIVYAEIMGNDNGENNHCRAILSYPVTAYYRPVIAEIIPSEKITINETDTLRVTARVIDEDTPGDKIEYKWYMNSEMLNVSRNYYEWETDYDSEGDYEIIIRATDDKGLYSQKKINLTVLNVNRPPVMRYPISDIVMREDENIKNIDLHVFFMDPDNDILQYSYDITYFEDSMNRSGMEELLELRIRDQAFSIRRLNPIEARIGLIITATDPYGAYARSNVFVIDVFDFNVTSRTLRGTADCPITTECSDWGFCTSDAIQTRQCIDKDCHGNEDLYLQKQACEPEATCFDGIQNCPFGICEEGIDCGGPCEQECRPCDHPSCMPIFCPGGCPDGHMCNTDRQCKSLKCQDYKCQPSTCDDGIRNQGEEGIDCGWPCEPCPTCFDGIQNQGEEGIDCGGPCDRDCITLSYLLKNYWYAIPIIGIVLSLLVLWHMIGKTSFLLRLISTLRIGRRYNDSKDRIFTLRKRIRYAIENPYGNEAASKAVYDGLLEEFGSILLRKSFMLSSYSKNIMRREKCDYLTRRLLINLAAKAKTQEASLFSVAYPVLLRELKESLDSYARALAYEKTTTHL